MRQAHANHTDAPKNHNNWDENARSQALEQDVRQRLKAGVGDEKDGEAGIVLAARDVEALLEAVEFCVANVGAVEEGDEVEEAEPRDQAEVEFPEEFAVLETRSIHALNC